MYRPCAPDGFIPNSVVREFYSIKPCEDTVVKEEWKPPVWRAEWDKISQGDSNDEGVRQWLSDDDDEPADSDISNTNDFSKRPHNKVVEKSSDAKLVAARKNTRTSSIASKNTDLHKRNVSSSLSTRTKDTKQQQNLQQNKEETSEEDKLKLELQHFNEEQNMDGQQLVPYPVLGIPYPLLDYYNKSWFPRDVQCDIPTVVSAIIGKLETSQVKDLNNMLQCVIKAHRYCPVDASCIDQLLSTLFVLLNNDNAQVRLCAVRALRELGIKRNDVIMQLIPRLADPSREVREEVKMALKELAGIIDAATLTSKLKELGKFKEVQVNNAVVISSVQDNVSSREKHSRDLADSEGMKNNTPSGLVIRITTPSSMIKLNKRRESINKDRVSQHHDDQDGVKDLIEAKTEESLPDEQDSQQYDGLSSRTGVRTEDLLSDDDKDGRSSENIHRRKSIRKKTVPGVLGERILSGIHMLPDIKNITGSQHKSGVIKAIPERHGCATVKKDGYTMYGKIGYQWTTYTSEYDMGISNHENERRRDGEMTTHHYDEDRNIGISTTMDINNKTLLPSIARQTTNKYENIYIY